MGLRLSNTFLLVLATIVTSSITLGQARGAGTTWQGTVTLCAGNATLQRGDQVLRLVRGGGLQSGDTIDAGDDANVALVLVDGPVIILDASTTVAIEQTGQQWQVNIERGEVRTIHKGETDLIVTTGDIALEIGRAIVQVATASSETRFEVVEGSIVVTSANQPPFTAARGEILSANSSGAVRQPVASDWDLEPGKIRLAAAMQTSPELNLPTPVIIDPILDASGDPIVSQDPETELQPFEEEEEQPQIVQTTPTTRGGEPDPMTNEMAQSQLVNVFGGSQSLSLGALASASTGNFTSGSLINSDSSQSFDGISIGEFMNGQPFRGVIRFITAETPYVFAAGQLTTSEFTTLFPRTGQDELKYFSIGNGEFLNLFSNNVSPSVELAPNSRAIRIPGHDKYLFQFDFVAGPGNPVPSPTDPNSPITASFFLDNRSAAESTNSVVGEFNGVEPALDPRAKLNQAATFAFGEFLVTPDGSNGVSIAIRRSDQDRTHEEGPPPNFGSNEAVTPNPDVEFELVDGLTPERFDDDGNVVSTAGGGVFGDVYRPVSIDPRGTRFTELSRLRKAAYTTLVADQLHEFASRTGRTRFVVDGQIIDISGYQRR